MQHTTCQFEKHSAILVFVIGLSTVVSAENNIKVQGHIKHAKESSFEVNYAITPNFFGTDTTFTVAIDKKGYFSFECEAEDFAIARLRSPDLILNK